MSKKEIELQKYLEKKKKQKNRDALLMEISLLSKNKNKDGIRLLKKKVKIKRKQEDSFENALFEKDSCESLTENPHECTSNIETEENSLVEHSNINEIDLGKEYENIQLGFKENSITEADKLTKESFILKDNVNAADNDLKSPEKDLFLNLNENFESRYLHRVESIQEERKKLDIFYEEADVVSKIKHNLITFVQGETGCGKTTQIPQFLYENGFANHGKIVISQPRRLSTVFISKRLNYEMNKNLAAYKIKYENTVTENTAIKVVTEGVLFREIQADFLLSEYSVVILDEVHERSANMDILVGLLSRIVKIRYESKNPLRLVLMSATVDPGIFEPVLNNFALINLKGKNFPVNVFFENKTPEDYVDCAFKKILAILESEHKIKSNKKQKDFTLPNEIKNDENASILVFLTSKEEIYRLKSMLDTLNKNITVLPLHSNLNKTEQARVFDQYQTRKVILATNIAETSITIDDIVFVIDCGKEKRRYIENCAVMFKTEFISKGSAKQRMGRAGRTRAGVCYRLYDGDTFEMFADNKLPEILVEPFDSILLQLKRLGVRNVFGFPFIDQPSEEMIQESLNKLESLSALNKEGNITKTGKRMCDFPVQPRYAKLLVKNIEETPEFFSKIVLLVSILSSNFELKKNSTTQAYFSGSKSDLIAYLKVYFDYQKTKKKDVFASSLGVSTDKFEEIRKMSIYLLKIARVDIDISKINNITMEEETRICRLLYTMLADQFAMNCGSSYLYKDLDLFISNDSIDPESQNIVFDYILCSYKKAYAKNITVISMDWFKK